MPFLTLNGVTIPTKAGGQIKYTEYGERTAGFDGSAQIDVRARKRQWEFTTKPISMVRARALEGLIHGNGIYIPFDTGGGTNTGLYTTNGMYPAALNGTPTIFNNTAADGSPAFDENQTRYALAGMSSAAFDPAASNVATAATASCNSTTGWTAGGSLTLSTTRYWEGTSSLNWAPSATNQSVAAPLYASAATAYYTVSCYIYSVNFQNLLSLQIIGASNAVVATKNIVHPGGGWYRFWITARITSGSVGLAVTSADTQPIFIDGVQYERAFFSATTSPPTSFMAGGVSRVLNDVTYSFVYPNPTGFAVSMWLANANAQQTISGLFTIYDASNNIIAYAQLSGITATIASLDFVVRTPTGFATTSANVTVPINAWTHVAMSYTGRAFTNSTGATLPNVFTYVNGVQVASSTLTTDLTGAFSTIKFGTITGNSAWSRMDDIQVLPFGIDAAWAKQTYTASSNLTTGAYGITGLTPFLTAAGDGIDGAPVAVHGSVKQANFIGYQSPEYGWISQGRQLQFVLTEV